MKACPKQAISLDGESLRYCRHCSSKYAACLSACSQGALIENRDGVIVVAGRRCDGCGKCVSACSSGGVRLGAGKAVKCDLCAGEQARKCVDACPHGALVLDEGERGCLVEVLPAVEFGPVSREGVVCSRAPLMASFGNGNGKGGGFRMRFVGDGKSIPTVRSGAVAEGGGAKGVFSDFSFRVLGLPPRAKVQLLGGRGRFKAFCLDGVRNVFFCGLPLFSDAELEVGRQARHFVIRESACELFCGDEPAAYFDAGARRARLEALSARAERILGELDALMAPDRRRELARMIAADTAGFGPIEFLWSESGGELEEIEVNHPLREIVVYHRKFGRCVTNLAFSGERAFRRVMNSVLQPLGGSLDLAHPSVDAQLPDGSRLHAQIYPLALSGASANIRFCAAEPWTVPKLVADGALSPEMAAFLWMAVEARRLSIVLTGPPASGKTSFLSSLLAFIPKSERVISVEEDLNELRFYDSFVDWVPLKGVHEERKAEAASRGSGLGSSRSALDQVINALRMRPDRIVLGELRGSEAQRLFSSANLGVPFMATMHSNERGTAVVKRLHSPPMGVPTESLSSLDLVVSLNFDGARRRRVVELSELSWRSRGQFPEPVPQLKSRGQAGFPGACVWRDGEEAVYANPLFSFDYSRRQFTGGGAGAGAGSRSIELFAGLFGVKVGDARGELCRRAEFVGRLAGSGKTSFLEVGEAVQAYCSGGSCGLAEVAEAAPGRASK